MRPRMAAAGHELLVPSYTGLGERAHLAHPRIDLQTHIQDILAVIEYEDLSNIVLVGHSYGGMVATGVADRAASRIRTLVYLDAFVPDSRQSLNDLTGNVPEAVEGWLVPPRPSAPDTSPEDLAWGASRRRHHPARCFAQKLHLSNPPFPVRHYIWCHKKDGHDNFAGFAARFKADPAWRCHDLDASHSPNITAPDALTALLSEIAG